jgi:hypothetical protein
MENRINPIALFLLTFSGILAAGAFTVVREAPRVRARYGFRRVSTAGVRVELAGLAGVVACVIGMVL